ncbi:MlaC/ttg2D family ABC transporter substrate-binding protein [Carnimonas nigrificans]|uniref:MlaC/ttg2D family ABC transporter substrate-binding protein n=1 Tax=Carnimonas nigrificans TaxID=64323 RepID=UPI00046FBDF5|nr:ABC transporter substrate-binding protein [Carnimonas nigrificans]
MKLFFKMCVAIGAVAALVMAGNVRADEQSPVDLVKTRITQLQQDTHGRAAEFKQHPNELRDLLAKNISPIADFPRISQMVMGRYNRLASAEQRANFARVFEKSTIDTLTQGLLSINYDSLEVNNLNQQQRYDDQANVSAEVKGTNGQNYPVSFTMSKRNGEWKVINVIVNGINLGLTFRNQFDQSMRQHNRDFDAVINSWDPSQAIDKIQDGGDS